jgi:hypothetical protein
MVTAFLITTAIANIALGYWLANFLRRASPAIDLVEQDHLAIDPLAGLTPPEPTPAATTPIEPAPPVAAAEAAPTATASEPEDEALEQDVLAGIEEFRNQLAQMKSRGEDEEQPLTAAHAAAGASG